MEKFFKLKEHNTTVKTELVAGLTTFFAMAYIIFVNPNMLKDTGMDFNAVMVATCLSAAIGTLLTAFMANVPFAQAPGMGLNAFFTYTLCMGMGIPWQTSLALVLISGIIFLIIAISPLRKLVIASIPASLKKAISAGIGLFIALIGLFNTGLVTTTPAGLVGLGNVISGPALVALIGLLVTAALIAFKVKGAIFIGIVVSTLMGFVFKTPEGAAVTMLPSGFHLTGFGTLAPIFGKAFTEGFAGLAAVGALPIITALITLIICDMFDTVGTLIGTASNAGMLDKDGNLPKGDKAIVADAIATCTGAVLGTSTVTTYVESSTGISEGGRTGLTSVVVGLLFLLAAFFFGPIALMVPGAATAPALIIVGVLMLKGAAEIEWDDFEMAVPCFLTIAIMPFTYSISNGIGFGFIFYTLIKLIRGKAKEVPALMYILTVVFMLMYILPHL